MNSTLFMYLISTPNSFFVMSCTYTSSSWTCITCLDLVRASEFMSLINGLHINPIYLSAHIEQSACKHMLYMFSALLAFKSHPASFPWINTVVLFPVSFLYYSQHFGRISNSAIWSQNVVETHSSVLNIVRLDCHTNNSPLAIQAWKQRYEQFANVMHGCHKWLKKLVYGALNV
jgi:hypothetical protein